MIKLILTIYVVLGVLIGIVITDLVVSYGRENDDLESINMFMNVLKDASNIDRIKLFTVIFVLYALLWPGLIVMVLMLIFKKN